MHGAEADVWLQALPASEYPAYRREAIFAACKWDPQIGDVNVIGDHAVLLTKERAAWLQKQAELLAAETVAADASLLARPELHRSLGLGGTLRRAFRHTLRASGGALPPDVRLMRFDFHPTTEGWAVSEVNSDVPGGFGESAVLPRLASRLLPGTSPADSDPASAVSRAFAGRLPRGARVALVHATAYTDDRQVMEYLAGSMREAGLDPIFVAPDLLRRDKGGRWTSGATGQEGEVHGIFRFFPAEWLPNLSGRWRDYFLPGPPACNHPVALLSQSKRLPLLWDRLGIDLPAWRELHPRTVDPRRADWEKDKDWVLKPAFGRVGEDVAVREVLSPKEWREIRKDARRYPRGWVAQRRFRSRPLPSARGERHVCVGVYTVEGRASGFYARIASHPRIDQYAEDAPVLVARRNT